MSDTELYMPPVPEIAADDVVRRLKVFDEDEAFVREALTELREAAAPKTLYAARYVEQIDGEDVTIGGVRFTSRVMAKNLADIHRVFAYVTTCGREADEWAIKKADGDPIVAVWLDMMKEMILGEAQKSFLELIKTRFGIERMSSMNPGSGNRDVWPIGQQTGLFRLLGDVEAAIGVTLTDSMLMVPNKTVSGILFPSESGYVNCALCSREACPNRRVPCDPALLNGG